jgi:hypothetical protein
MNAFGRDRLAALAMALGMPPRAVLVAAARMTREGMEDAARHRTLRDARAGRAMTRSSAALLLATPVADFALDDVDRALTMPGAAPP